jgi:nucleotide-binding universal stress UspA family protein
MSTSEAPRARYVIVVGDDDSDASAAAIEEASRLAERAPAGELHVVHVMPVPTPSASPSAPSGASDLAYLAEIQESGRMLRARLDPLRTRGMRLAAHVRLGRPDREIAQLATDLGADLIVVGVHGRRGIQRLLLGSVTESLVRHAPCPVLAHRAKAAEPWELIQPPCPDCLAVRQQTERATLWCPRHAEHHLRAHTYHDYPDSYAMGSQTFRSE